MLLLVLWQQRQGGVLVQYSFLLLMLLVCQGCSQLLQWVEAWPGPCQPARPQLQLDQPSPTLPTWPSCLHAVPPVLPLLLLLECRVSMLAVLLLV
jgi:hypothetical protein